MAMITEERKFIDPLTAIGESDLPVLVFVDDLRSWFGLAIKAHSNGNYNHVMWLYKRWMLASQGWLYSSVSFEKYSTPNVMLKFWTFDIPADEKAILLKHITDGLAAPWWQRFYDVPGLIGQAVHARQIQVPGLNYCSERVSSDLRVLPRFAHHVGPRPTPVELNVLMNQEAETRCLGYWLRED